ncbi:MAG: four-carbon acid sugar kinase family protein [Pseudolysinimonas sp.]
MTPAHGRPRIIVLDDDPTGTQGVAGLPIVLTPDAATLAATARSWAGPIWVLTNTRAMSEPAAVATLVRITDAIATSIASRPRLVLRGDSTLRGHVLAEIDALRGDDGVGLFVPAFLEQGRVTVDGVHYAEVEGRRVPVAETEYANDHEFGYDESGLVNWVVGRDPQRVAIPFGYAELRSAGGASALRDVLLTAPAGSIVVPDAETPADLELIADAWQAAVDRGRTVILRCAASLASVVTDSPPRWIGLPASAGSVLVVCASYTTGARDQLAALEAAHATRQVRIDIDEALGGADRAAAQAAALAAACAAGLRAGEVVVLSTPRSTAPEHLTLAAGEAIMDVVIGTVSRLRILPSLLITKGGITGARVARDGMHASTAIVRGQPFPGVPLWRLALPGDRTLDHLVVPGNVGGPELIADAVPRQRAAG